MGTGIWYINHKLLKFHCNAEKNSVRSGPVRIYCCKDIKLKTSAFFAETKDTKTLKYITIF